LDNNSFELGCFGSVVQDDPTRAIKNIRIIRFMENSWNKWLSGKRLSWIGESEKG